MSLVSDTFLYTVALNEYVEISSAYIANLAFFNLIYGLVEVDEVASFCLTYPNPSVSPKATVT